MKRSSVAALDDRLMAVKQVATYLNVNERTVLKLVSEGRIPAVKVGSQWRFRKEDVDQWLDSNKNVRQGATPEER